MDQAATISTANSKREALIPIIRLVIAELMKVLTDRGDSYQDYEDNAQVHVDMMDKLMGPRWTEHLRKPHWAEGAMTQITSKLSRIAMRDGEFHRDNWLDIAGYAIIATAIRDRSKLPNDIASSNVRPDPGDSMYEEVLATQDVARLPTIEQLAKRLTNMKFTWAVAQLNQGLSIRRSSWPAKECIWYENVLVNRKDPQRQLVCRSGFGYTPYILSTDDLTCSEWELHESA